MQTQPRWNLHKCLVNLWEYSSMRESIPVVKGGSYWQSLFWNTIQGDLKGEIKCKLLLGEQAGVWPVVWRHLVTCWSPWAPSFRSSLLWEAAVMTGSWASATQTGDSWRFWLLAFYSPLPLPSGRWGHGPADESVWAGSRYLQHVCVCFCQSFCFTNTCF